MIAKLTYREWPHFQLWATFGTSLLSELTSFQISRFKEFNITNDSPALFDEVRRIIDLDEFADLLDSLYLDHRNSVVGKLNSIFAAENIKLIIKGIRYKKSMIGGVPSAFSVKIIFDNTRLGEIELYFQNEVCFYDSNKDAYVRGLEIKAGYGIFSVSEVWQKGSACKYYYPSLNNIKSNIKQVVDVLKAEVIGFTDEGNIFVKAELNGSNQLCEYNQMVYFDSKQNKMEIIKLLDKEEFNVKMNNFKNNLSREASKMQKPVVAYSGALIDILNKSNYDDVKGIVRVDYNSVKAYRDFVYKTMVYEKILQKGKKSYSQLKDCLNLNLSLADNLGGVNVADKSLAERYLVDNFLTVKIEGFNARVSDIPTRKVSLVAEDTLGSFDFDNAKVSITKRTLIDNIENGIKECKRRITENELIFSNNYSQQYNYYTTLLQQRAIAFNNIILANASAKVFLAQFEAITNLEVRSWWNNSLMGTVASFIKETKDAGNKYTFEFDLEKLKSNYNKVSSDYEFKFEKCEAWVVLRSGSPEHTMFDETRTKDDWRYNATDYPVTIPSSSLDNLGITYGQEAPQTATQQEYVSCGKTQVIVRAAKQVTRPRISRTDFANQFKKVLETLTTSYYDFMKLYESSKASLEIIDKQIEDAAVTLGFIESKRFAANVLASNLFVLQRQKEMLINYINSEEEELILFNVEDGDVGVELNPIQEMELRNSIALKDLDTTDVVQLNEDGTLNATETKQMVTKYYQDMQNIEKLITPLNGATVNFTGESELELEANLNSYKLSFEIKKSDNKIIYKIHPKQVTPVGVLKDIRINEIACSVSDILIWFYCCKCLGEEEAAAERISLITGVSRETLEMEYANAFKDLEALKDKYSLSVHSILAYLNYTSPHLTTDELSVAFSQKQENVHRANGPGLAGTLLKFIEEECHVN